MVALATVTRLTLAMFAFAMPAVAAPVVARAACAVAPQLKHAMHLPALAVAARGRLMGGPVALIASRLGLVLLARGGSCVRAFGLRAIFILAATLFAAGGATAQTGGDVGTAAHPLAGRGADLSAAARARPLFSPTRRPPSAAPRRVVLPPAPVEAEPELVLIGVMELSGRVVAIVEDLEEGTTVSLQPGDIVGRWTVEAVAADSITLSDGDQSVALQLFDPGRPHADAPDPEPDNPTPYPRHALSDVSSDTLVKILRGELKIER
ncbi:hypothetical protein [Acuticoccus yangtzensis]|uniref:hypothetical protein n=1 Tax=Acuticoccus yangtzensis TaxID=1443441 RepID=UPI0011151960|nr:hypothetical protein [Acuticoccus yangtzensis]